jgi:hypothetical protein
MRLPRLRISVLGLMLAVAVAAVLITLAIRMHAQPVRVTILDEGGYRMTWSDGSVTRLGPDAPMPSMNGGERFAFGFLRRVKWFDGSRTSYTWHTSWPSEPIPEPPPD